MWTILKFFIEFVTVLFLVYVLVFWPWGIWGLSSPTRVELTSPALEGREILTTGPPGKSLPFLNICHIKFSAYCLPHIPSSFPSVRIRPEFLPRPRRPYIVSPLAPIFTWFSPLLSLLLSHVGSAVPPEFDKCVMFGSLCAFSSFFLEVLSPEISVPFLLLFMHVSGASLVAQR